MTEDGRLLEQWKRQKSQAAFAALVTRHLDFVYSVCLREMGDPALADDVTQVVFLLLARKAPSLGPDTRLTGWLFQTARFACKNALRRDASRRRREQKVGEQMRTEASEQDALWEQVAPRLNAALASLAAKDREAVLLRFADGLSFSELGTALGTSEDAARMRVARALTRLRGFFAKQGVSVTALVLTGLLVGRTTQAAPASCTAAVQQIAARNLALLPPQTNAYLQGVLHTMKLTKITAAVAAFLVLVAAGLIVNIRHVSQKKIVSSNSVAQLGSVSLPTIPGWTKQYQQFPPTTEAVYYKPIADKTALSAKVVQISPFPEELKDFSPPPLSESKADIEKTLTDPKLSLDSHTTIRSSQIVTYKNQPALSMVWNVQEKQILTNIRMLTFYRGGMRYTITLYAHSQTPATKIKAALFWKALTDGLRG